jgi:hypothetical protein
MTMRKLLIVGLVALALGVMMFRPAIGESILYSMAWWTVDGGGYVSTGTVSTGSGETMTTTVVYTLTSTIAQPDAGWMTGGAYSLAGGFWGSPVGPSLKLYLPMVRGG